jgi:twinkle protein
MIAAGTSIGKSTLLREDIYHLLKTTDEKIGAIFLEEDVGETVGGLMSIHLNKRLGLPGVEATTEEERLAWEATAGQPNRIILLDHQGSLSDNSLIDKIEYMALSGCKYLYLDHITIAVSETEDGNPNAAIDKFMSDLLKLVKRHNIWIGVVSHLRKVKSGEDSFESGAPISEDDLKGSGSLKQISFQTIAISRNKLAENELVRNRSQIYLLKDRKTGNTGPAGAYRYNSATGRLEEVEKRDEDEFEIITTKEVA